MPGWLQWPDKQSPCFHTCVLPTIHLQIIIRLTILKVRQVKSSSWWNPQVQHSLHTWKGIQTRYLVEFLKTNRPYVTWDKLYVYIYCSLYIYIALCLGFFIYKMKRMQETTSQAITKMKCVYRCKVLGIAPDTQFTVLVRLMFSFTSPSLSSSPSLSLSPATLQLLNSFSSVLWIGQVHSCLGIFEQAILPTQNVPVPDPPNAWRLLVWINLNISIKPVPWILDYSKVHTHSSLSHDPILIFWIILVTNFIHNCLLTCLLTVTPSTHT